MGSVGERNVDALTDLTNHFNELFSLGDGEHVALLLRSRMHAAEHAQRAHFL